MFTYLMGYERTSRNTSKLDQMITGYTASLRLVVSDHPNTGNEPWYIVTNDLISTREGLITDYYHRFEIEEFFKDAKWLQNLEQLRVRKKLSMSVVLWFVILGWWAAALMTRAKVVVQGQHSHDQLSWLRLIQEALLREQNLIVEQHLAVHTSSQKEVMLA